MTQRDFILVSPGPIDGYPPVQYQARLLADAGHRVEVVTMPLRADQSCASFTHPGVQVTCISGKVAFGGPLQRHTAYCTAVFAARGRVNRATAVEIAYDPNGIFYSDVTPRKPRVRVAHFHEILQYTDSFFEKRLSSTIRKYDHIVVADKTRAVHTQKTLELRNTPIVIENYPLLAVGTPRVERADLDRFFEVIYCGSLGYNQKLDIVIRSVIKWPEHGVLTLIGDDNRPTARKLKDLAHSVGVADRVQFIGWMDIDDAEARLMQADLAVALLDMGSEQLRTSLGASNKRYQYMKAGLPQIGDQCPGVPDLIESKGIGFCVSEQSVDAIASAVKIYIDDHARCTTEGARAFGLHQSRFHYERVFQRLIDTLNQA